MEKVTLGIHFVLRMNKIINGMAPIYARITVNSKRCEVSIKRKVPVESWNFGKGMAKPSSSENKQLNSYLEQIRKMIAIGGQIDHPVAIQIDHVLTIQTDHPLSI